MAVSGAANHSDGVATAAAFNVDVKLQAVATAAARAMTSAAVGDEASRGGRDDNEPGTVPLGTGLSTTASTTLSAVMDNGVTDHAHSKMKQLEEDVDNLMEKMGIHGRQLAVFLLVLLSCYSLFFFFEFLSVLLSK